MVVWSQKVISDFKFKIMYRIIQKRNWLFAFSILVMVPGIVALFAWGLKLGIDFTGGSLIDLKFTKGRPETAQIQELVKQSGVGEAQLQTKGESGMALRLRHLTNEEHQKLIDDLKAKFAVEEESYETVGPTIGKELRDKSITLTVLVLVFIVAYIAWSFRKVSRGPVKSWAYGLAAVIALIHDLVVVVGIFAILGHYFNIELDSLFVTAVLTVLGFSVHDTIVVFDRIRERIGISSTKSFEDLVNESLNQTLVRSLNTSLTTLLVLFALYLFGGESIKNFILALLIGITSGTYSSIFVAAALLVVWHDWKKKVA